MAKKSRGNRKSFEKKEEKMSKEIAKLEPAVITADFDSMKGELDKKLAIYQGHDVEDLAKQETTQLRKERADINGIINEVEDARKSIKRAYNAPLTEFEKQCKELLGPARTLSAQFKEAIDKQANQFKEDRYNELKTLFEESAGALLNVVDFDIFMDKDYFKKSYSLDKARDKMMSTDEQLASDWESLKKLNLQYQHDAELVLFSTLDLGQAIQTDENKRAEVERIEKLNKIVAENKGDKKKPVSHWNVSLTCTKQELDRVISFCKENGIKGTYKANDCE